jgi:N-acetylneuraminic acid mutarotase
MTRIRAGERCFRLALLVAGLAATVLTVPAAAHTPTFEWAARASAPLARFEAQGAAVGGDLYVFGGFYTTTIKATSAAHAFDAAGNAWRPIASMPRLLTHAGVAVDGDAIYLAGGFLGDHPGPAVDDVWRYDTVTDRWSSFVPLPEPRGAGALVRVGRTLHFFGGINLARNQDKSTHWTLELDAAAPSWRERAPMPNARNHLGGVTFAGRACALGGQHLENEVSGNQADFQCYDAEAERWDALPPLPKPRGHITSSTFVLRGRPIALGGTLNGNVTATDVAVYDPGSRTWVALPALPAGRKSPVAGVIGDAMLSSTGNASSGAAPSTTTWSGTLPGTWSAAAELPLPLGEVAGGVVGRKLYLVGEGSPSTLAYDLSLGGWTTSLAQRPAAGHHHAAEVVGGRLYLLGGLGRGAGEVQVYDPAANAWTGGADMPFAAGSSASALIDGKIYVAGGIVGSSTTNQAARYEPATDAWTPIAPMPEGRNHAASGTDGHRLYVFGGRVGGNAVSNGFATVQIYDPATNRWTSSSDPGSGIPPLPQARGGMGKAVYHGGEFYVMGGETSTGSDATAAGVYARVDVYNPTTRTWRAGVPMPTARHGIFPLAHAGRLHVPGGGVQAGNSQARQHEVFNALGEGGSGPSPPTPEPLPDPPVIPPDAPLTLPAPASPSDPAAQRGRTPGATEAPARRVGSKIRIRFRLLRRSTRVTRITALDVPAGAVIELRCRGRGCFEDARRVARPGAARSLVLWRKLVRRHPLAAGATLGVRVLNRGSIGHVARFTMRRGRPPRSEVLCLPPTARRAADC